MNDAMLEPSPRDVDAAVRSVLADLFAADRKTRWGLREGGKTKPEDVFAGRLLSIKQVERLPSTLSELKVAPGTVVTPLARDLLKARGIALRYVARREVDRAANVGEWGIAIEDESGYLQAFRRIMLDDPVEWRDLGDSAQEAAYWVGEAESRGALVLTEEASVTVYRASQLPGVRAAAVEEPMATARAIRSLGVNLLVVEPAGKSIAFLRQIGKTFRGGGGPVAPGWLNDLAGGRTS